MSLEEYSDEQLQNELRERKNQLAVSKRPKVVKDNDSLRELVNLCEDYINFIDSEEYHEDNDYDHYIFEKAMEFIYGSTIWDYINSKEI